MQTHPSDTQIFSFNHKAMDSLRNEDYKSALFYLTKAEALLKSTKVQNANMLYGITLNNFGCFYKRTGNPTLALSFLTKALELETKPPIHPNNLAGTHLNICAILSQINDHHKALSHALKALSILKSKYLEDPALLTTLLVAHHNAGIEYEHLSQISEAYNIYYQGWQLSIENFGENHPLTISLMNSVRNLRVTRKTISGSPLRNTPLSQMAKHRTSVPRSYKGSEKSSSSKFEHSKVRADNIRFVTGERLQPMHKSEGIKVKAVKPRKKYDANALIQELNGESSRGVEEFTMEKTHETKPEENQSEKVMKEPVEKVSIAIQADIVDKNLFRTAKESAATVIQKYCRGFLAKRRFEVEKYSRQLKEAENKARLAKEKLNGLGRFRSRHISLVETASSDMVPVAFRSKISSPDRGSTDRSSTDRSMSIKETPSRSSTDRPLVFTSKKVPVLKTIPEEKEVNHSRIVKIQKHAKGWAARKKYIRLKEAAIIIQKHFKRYMCKKLYQGIREAVIFIQRFWRRYLKSSVHSIKKMRSLRFSVKRYK